MTTTINLTINLWWVIVVGAYLLVNLILMLYVNKGNTYDLSGTLFILCTGLPLIIITSIYAFFTEALHIVFFWNYFIAKKSYLHKASIEMLYKWNRNIGKFSTQSIHDRIYRFSVRLVNKKNNYTFGPGSEQEYKQYMRSN